VVMSHPGERKRQNAPLISEHECAAEACHKPQSRNTELCDFPINQNPL
jgi:hypothetical protein